MYANFLLDTNEKLSQRKAFVLCRTNSLMFYLEIMWYTHAQLPFFLSTHRSFCYVRDTSATTIFIHMTSFFHLFLSTFFCSVGRLLFFLFILNPLRFLTFWRKINISSSKEEKAFRCLRVGKIKSYAVQIIGAHIFESQIVPIQFRIISFLCAKTPKTCKKTNDTTMNSETGANISQSTGRNVELYVAWMAVANLLLPISWCLCLSF